MIMLSVILIVVFGIIHFRYKRRRLYHLASKIPGSAGIPVIGSAHRFIGNTERIMSSLQTLSYKCIEGKDGIRKAWLGPILFTIVINPLDVEKVARSCLEKDGVQRFFKHLMGNGILFAPVQIWRIRRKIMTATLTPKMVEKFLHSFEKNSQKLAEKLRPCCGTGQFDIIHFISRYVLETVCEAAFGLNINAQEDPTVPFLTAFNRYMNLTCERILKVWLHPDSLYKLFRSKYDEHEKCCHIIHEFLDKVISQKRKAKETNELCGTENNLNLLKNQEQTLLDHMITVSGGENGYSNEELREEILNIILAAIDTSAVTIANTLVMLKKYPIIQERVHQELTDVFKDSNCLLKEDLSKLVYLERVIKETMRLYPNVPFMLRQVSSETKLPSGYVLPAGSHVAIGIWGIHRHPVYWGPDAECFDPDRFLPERLNLPHSLCYLPFGAGSRYCVGYHYAMISMKAALAAILRSYKVVGMPEEEPVSQMKMKIEITMKAVDGWPVGLEIKN